MVQIEDQIEGPDHCPKRDVVCQISINVIWMCISGGLVPRSRF